MFINLSSSVHGQNIKHACIAVSMEQDSPTANARFSDAGALGQGCREPGVKRLLSEHHYSPADTFLGRPVQPVEDLLSLAGNDYPNRLQPAFALVLLQWFNSPLRNILESPVERRESVGIKRSPSRVSRIAQVLQPMPCQVHLVFGQLINKFVQCLSGSHPSAPLPILRLRWPPLCNLPGANLREDFQNRRAALQ